MRSIGRAVLVATVAVSIAAATLPSSSAGDSPPESKRWTSRALPPDPVLPAGRYVVTLAQPPVASYDGSRPGFARTRPVEGNPLRPRSASARAYRTHLRNVQDRVLDRTGVMPYYRYTDTINGFAARLTRDQAEQLATMPGVLSVVPDSTIHGATDSSPAFLGLSGKSGVWKLAGGPSRAGQGQVIGVIDSGIWPESTSFAGRPQRPSDLPPGWGGTCQTGEQWTAKMCTDKIIGARFYTAGIGAANIPQAEFVSPRDYAGHGTHTASTSAGKPVTSTVVDGINRGAISGIAPAAQIAVYKACYGLSVGCVVSDLVAAIDDAVTDGVDVINFSIAGIDTGVDHPIQLAFLNAATAGVFVAAAAGNFGPDAGNIDNVSPWVTTVAAASHRVFEQKLVLGNGQKFVGVSATPSLTTAKPFVLGEDAMLPGGDVTAAQRCAPSALDPTRVSGKVVMCLVGPGSPAPRDVTYAVRSAGGLGAVLVSFSNAAPPGPVHAIPTVHLLNPDVTAIVDYAHTATPTARILPTATGDSTTSVPEVARFSGRGPVASTGGEILKPDLAAPGVNVLAAVSPTGYSGRSFDRLTGTSMASPHVAGLALLIKQLKPSWSPMAIKSALMTTARDHVSTSSANDGPFAQGAGFVQPQGALDPGVVFESGPGDWLPYLTSRGLDLADHVIGGADVNAASVALGRLVSSRTVTRRLTNVTARTETYTPQVSIPDFTVTFSPTVITVPANGTASVQITVARGNVPLSTSATGSMTFVGSRGHRARIPLVVGGANPTGPNGPRLSLEVPFDVPAASADGRATIVATPWWNGTLGAVPDGPVEAVSDTGTVEEGPFDPQNPAESASVVRKVLDVPEDLGYLEAELAGSPSDNLDLYLYQVVAGQERLVNAYEDPWSTVIIRGTDVPVSTYVVYIRGTDVVDGSFTWTTWHVPPGAAAGSTVSPASVTVREGQPVELVWTWAPSNARLRGTLGFDVSGTAAIPWKLLLSGE